MITLAEYRLCLYLIMPPELENGLVTESTKASYLKRLELTTILGLAFVIPMPGTKRAMLSLKSLTIEAISLCQLSLSMTVNGKIKIQNLAN